MKFAKTLQSEVVLEWSTKYVDYKGLKGKLRAVERAKRIRENRLSSTTFRRSIESNRNNANYNHDFEAPTRPQGLFSNSSQRAMSFTSMAESTSSWFNKVSTMLTNWRKHPADYVSPEHNPTPIVITSLETLMLQANRPEREFFTMLQKELDKVNEFYELQERETLDSFEVVKRQYSQTRWSRRSGSQVTGSPDERQQKETKHKDAKKLFKKALFEIYRGTELLRKYRALNQIAFIKILKKYDKIANVNARKLYMRTIVNEKNFVKSKKLENLAREIEDFYSDHFEEGSRRRSMKKLRVPSKKNVQHYSSVWRTGVYLGMALPFFIHSVYLAFKRNQEMFLSDLNHTVDPNDYPYNRDRYYIMQLYAGMGIPIVFMLMIGVNMYVWTRARINYKFIFEFDPRDNIDYHQYLEIPSFMSLALSFFMYITIQNTFGIHQEDYPKILMVLILVFLLMPTKTFYYSARRWFISTIARIFASPFTNVGFRDFFLADELTSLSYSFTTLQLFLCTCTHDSNNCTTICATSKSIYTPLLASIPAIIRSLQCLRRLYDTHKKIHMINFGKYMSTVLATCMLSFHRRGDPSSFETVKIIWVISQLVNSVYTILWDVKMDWRLFQPDSKLFLREQLEYRHTWFYYCGIAANAMLRFGWVLLLIRDTSPVGFVVALGEVLRRWIWNFFRVENDHANNCHNTRAIGIDKIIGKLLDKPIFDKKDLGDFSTRSDSEAAKNGWKDFEIRSNNEEYEYNEDYEDEDEDEDDEFYKDGSIPRKYLISVDLSNTSGTGLYASRRLPLSISNIIEMPEDETDDSSLV